MILELMFVFNFFAYFQKGSNIINPIANPKIDKGESFSVLKYTIIKYPK